MTDEICCGSSFGTFEAVSYTHLDVYKRQRQRNAQRDAGRGQDDDGRVKRRKSFFHAVPPLFSGAAAAARLIPPSKWAESWGCALSCGTKRRTPSRGYAF